MCLLEMRMDAVPLPVDLFSYKILDKRIEFIGLHMNDYAKTSCSQYIDTRSGNLKGKKRGQIEGCQPEEWMPAFAGMTCFEMRCQLSLA